MWQGRPDPAGSRGLGATCVLCRCLRPAAADTHHEASDERREVYCCAVKDAFSTGPSDAPSTTGGAARTLEFYWRGHRYGRDRRRGLEGHGAQEAALRTLRQVRFAESELPETSPFGVVSHPDSHYSPRKSAPAMATTTTAATMKYPISSARPTISRITNASPTLAVAQLNHR